MKKKAPPSQNATFKFVNDVNVPIDDERTTASTSTPQLMSSVLADNVDNSIAASSLTSIPMADLKPATRQHRTSTRASAIESVAIKETARARDLSTNQTTISYSHVTPRRRHRIASRKTAGKGVDVDVDAAYADSPYFMDVGVTASKNRKSTNSTTHVSLLPQSQDTNSSDNLINNSSFGSSNLPSENFLDGQDAPGEPEFDKFLDSLHNEPPNASMEDLLLESGVHSATASVDMEAERLDPLDSLNFTPENAHIDQILDGVSETFSVGDDMQNGASDTVEAAIQDLLQSDRVAPDDHDYNDASHQDYPHQLLNEVSAQLSDLGAAKSSLASDIDGTKQLEHNLGGGASQIRHRLLLSQDGHNHDQVMNVESKIDHIADPTSLHDDDRHQDPSQLTTNTADSGAQHLPLSTTTPPLGSAEESPHPHQCDDSDDLGEMSIETDYNSNAVPNSSLTYIQETLGISEGTVQKTPDESGGDSHPDGESSDPNQVTQSQQEGTDDDPSTTGNKSADGKNKNANPIVAHDDDKQAAKSPAPVDTQSTNTKTSADGQDANATLSKSSGRHAKDKAKPNDHGAKKGPTSLTNAAASLGKQLVVLKRKGKKADPQKTEAGNASATKSVIKPRRRTRARMPRARANNKPTVESAKLPKVIQKSNAADVPKADSQLDTRRQTRRAQSQTKATSANNTNPTETPTPSKLAAKRRLVSNTLLPRCMVNRKAASKRILLSQNAYRTDHSETESEKETEVKTKATQEVEVKTKTQIAKATPLTTSCADDEKGTGESNPTIPVHETIADETPTTTTQVPTKVTPLTPSCADDGKGTEESNPETEAEKEVKVETKTKVQAAQSKTTSTTASCADDEKGTEESNPTIPMRETVNRETAEVLTVATEIPDATETSKMDEQICEAPIAESVTPELALAVESSLDDTKPAANADVNDSSEMDAKLGETESAPIVTRQLRSNSTTADADRSKTLEKDIVTPRRKAKARIVRCPSPTKTRSSSKQKLTECANANSPSESDAQYGEMEKVRIVRKSMVEDFIDDEVLAQGTDPSNPGKESTKSNRATRSPSPRRRAARKGAAKRTTTNLSNQTERKLGEKMKLPIVQTRSKSTPSVRVTRAAATLEKFKPVDSPWKDLSITALRVARRAKGKHTQPYENAYLDTASKMEVEPRGISKPPPTQTKAKSTTKALVDDDKHAARMDTPNPPEIVAKLGKRKRAAITISISTPLIEVDVDKDDDDATIVLGGKAKPRKRKKVITPRVRLASKAASVVEDLEEIIPCPPSDDDCDSYDECDNEHSDQIWKPTSNDKGVTDQDNINKQSRATAEVSIPRVRLASKTASVVEELEEIIPCPPSDDDGDSYDECDNEHSDQIRKPTSNDIGVTDQDNINKQSLATAEKSAAINISMPSMETKIVQVDACHAKETKPESFATQSTVDQIECTSVEAADECVNSVGHLSESPINDAGTTSGMKRKAPDTSIEAANECANSIGDTSQSTNDVQPNTSANIALNTNANTEERSVEDDNDNVHLERIAKFAKRDTPNRSVDYRNEVDEGGVPIQVVNEEESCKEQSPALTLHRISIIPCAQPLKRPSKERIESSIAADDAVDATFIEFVSASGTPPMDGDVESRQSVKERIARNKIPVGQEALDLNQSRHGISNFEEPNNHTNEEISEQESFIAAARSRAASDEEITASEGSPKHQDGSCEEAQSCVVRPRQESFTEGVSQAGEKAKHPSHTTKEESTAPPQRKSASEYWNDEEEPIAPAQRKSTSEYWNDDEESEGEHSQDRKQCDCSAQTHFNKLSSDVMDPKGLLPGNKHDGGFQKIIMVSRNSATTKNKSFNAGQKRSGKPLSPQSPGQNNPLLSHKNIQVDFALDQKALHVPEEIIVKQKKDAARMPVEDRYVQALPQPGHAMDDVISSMTRETMFAHGRSELLMEHRENLRLRGQLDIRKFLRAAGNESDDKQQSPRKPPAVARAQLKAPPGETRNLQPEKNSGKQPRKQGPTSTVDQVETGTNVTPDAEDGVAGSNCSADVTLVRHHLSGDAHDEITSIKTGILSQAGRSTMHADHSKEYPEQFLPDFHANRDMFGMVQKKGPHDVSPVSFDDVFPNFAGRNAPDAAHTEISKEQRTEFGNGYINILDGGNEDAFSFDDDDLHFLAGEGRGETKFRQTESSAHDGTVIANTDTKDFAERYSKILPAKDGIDAHMIKTAGNNHHNKHNDGTTTGGRMGQASKKMNLIIPDDTMLKAFMGIGKAERSAVIMHGHYANTSRAARYESDDSEESVTSYDDLDEKSSSEDESSEDESSEELALRVKKKTKTKGKPKTKKQHKASAFSLKKQCKTSAFPPKKKQKTSSVPLTKQQRTSAFPPKKQQKRKRKRKVAAKAEVHMLKVVIPSDVGNTGTYRRKHPYPFVYPRSVKTMGKPSRFGWK